MVISDNSDKKITPQLSSQAANVFIWVNFYWWTRTISILEATHANLDGYNRPCKKNFSCEGTRAGRPKHALPSKKLVKGEDRRSCDGTPGEADKAIT